MDFSTFLWAEAIFLLFVRNSTKFEANKPKKFSKPKKEGLSQSEPNKYGPTPNLVTNRETEYYQSLPQTSLNETFLKQVL